ncbi:bifunctional prephenate dehydrogenase/3-phosphoshikimate 1-carboxyvinyltransferase [Psychrobacter sp. I-STPA10]|uniref:bifunctional prephenate dehydrogenase/3-phosphoshikimate 1-carboxyvinyltransferase n=1 Tax=Psychrobacter sp. I-STPA10 TaxID=2585769 RepID=UPI001E507C54|nr:bifunctional prephenate dehydrogenase/3-phosphoshikimate 1-carboxyvinyltransferase [Psychrobacter sp. I-STPA10]
MVTSQLSQQPVAGQSFNQNIHASVRSHHIPIFERVCVIGLGLIGASLVQAIHDHQLSRRIVAVDKNAASIEAALSDGIIAAGSDDLRTLIQSELALKSDSIDSDSNDGIDCIIIAIPVKAVAAVWQQIAQAMQAGEIAPTCVISDVCSTKKNIIDAAQAAFAQVGQSLPSSFVPAHPIAGAENSGYHARRADLFVNHSVIVCQLESSSAEAVQKVIALWQGVGASVMPMAAEYHDTVLAYTSHLPHLLAFNLVEQLASHDDNMDIFRYAAGGFRDFTRIAASDPIMWHDIFFANQDAVIAALDEYSNYLQQLRHLITTQDSTALLGLLGRAQAARRHFGHMLSSTPYTTSQMDNNMTASYIITPSQQVQGSINVPGDKSISHRSIMFGSLAEGVTRVTGFLEGEDALATLQAFRDMGVTIEGPDNGNVVIHGVGMHGLKPSRTPLYMGNSGTSMRLLSGILAAQRFNSVLTGDSSLSKRPMERVATPLRQMGAVIQTTGERGCAPISITGSDATGSQLTGIDYDLPVPSAQVKSCVLLAGLWASGTTTVTEPEVTRDHTERMLSAFGYEVEVDGNSIRLQGGGKLTACDIAVPADISSAAFFMVAAAIARDSKLTIQQVGMNPTRTGVIDILKLMGANISISNQTYVGQEPVADITIESSDLQGIEIPENLVPLAIDEFPVLFVAASCARGQTVLTGAKELRVKESDRIAVMADGLQTLGVDCEVTEDGIIINGGGVSKTDAKAGQWQPVFTGGEIYSHHDHRIAMSFAIASIRAQDTITIHGVETVNTSFPGFAELANQIGLSIATKSN